jgi:4-alpha-glucanotransferase
MLFNHSSAILLHPTSLPGPYGIGDLGPSAYRWLDWQAGSGARWWQMLPLGPTGYADSPYASFSAFAGNPMLISPDLLVQQGLLNEADVAEHPDFPDHKVDYGAANAWKENLLSRAFEAAGADPALQADFTAFRQQERGWLEDYALFMALKDQHDMRPWWQWDEALRNRQQSALKAFSAEHRVRIDRHAFLQFIFFQQWEQLRQRMAELDIRVIGDVPIYVARDSVDLWANPHLFELDEERNPSAVAGVPPDYFSETGQLWGNPLYDWAAHAEEGYAWWFARLRAVLKLVDVVRLDHFRGFYDYWAVPAGAEDAVNGEWRQGPADRFFKALREEFGELPLIAEDLGEINPEVFKLRDRFNLPGMKILQFAFDGGIENDFLPHNYPENCVAYSGTHDNDTSVGWYAKAAPQERAFCNEYLHTNGEHIAWRFIETLWASRADLVAAPMQDFLELGSHARMNIPSTIGGNWAWRLRAEDLSDELAHQIAILNEQNTR